MPLLQVSLFSFLFNLDRISVNYLVFYFISKVKELLIVHPEEKGAIQDNASVIVIVSLVFRVASLLYRQIYFYYYFLLCENISRFFLLIFHFYGFTLGLGFYSFKFLCSTKKEG